MTAVTASRVGWEAVFLGPGLAAEDIAFVVERRGVRAVALSLCYPDDAPQIPGQLAKLRGRARRSADLRRRRGIALLRRCIAGAWHPPSRLGRELDQLRRQPG